MAESTLENRQGVRIYFKITDYELWDKLGRNAKNIAQLKAAREKKNGHLINTTAIR